MSFAKVLLAIILIVLFAEYLLPDITSPEFKAFLERYSAWGALVVVGYIIVSHVIAPLVGSPMVFLSAAIFGINRTMLFLYTAGLISSVINFHISRKFGRAWVQKLAGEKNMREMDRFLGVSTLKVFIFARVFGFAIFDVISYAAGFTKISFRKYFYLTAIFYAIPLISLAFIFRDFDFSSGYNFVIWIMSLLLVGAVFAFGFRRYLFRKLNQKIP